MRKIAILVLLILLPAAQALEIVDYEARVELSDMTPHEEVRLVLLNTDESPVGELSYPFSGRAVNLTVSDSSGEITSSLEYKGGKAFSTTQFRKAMFKDNSYTLTYNFETREGLSKKENTYILATTHTLLANVENFKLSIVLPEGYGITDEGVSPKPERMSSDGRKVILNWDYRKPIPTELREFKVIVLYEKLLQEEPIVVIKEVEVEKTEPEGYGVYPYLVAVLSALVIVTLVMYLREKGFSPTNYLARRRYIEGKIDILKEDEQSILKMVIEEDGIDQRDIQRVSDFSKTKVSKILSELEKRGAITKQQVGRRNKIFLAKRMKEV